MTEFFDKKRWSELNASDLQIHGQTDGLFSVEAYCYFLPAYLIASMVDPRSLDICVEHLAYRFGPRDGDSFSIDRIRSVVSSLSEAQRLSTLGYFQFAQVRDGDFEGFSSRAIRNLAPPDAHVS